MDKQFSGRRFPSTLNIASSITKLALLGLMSCLLFLVPYTYIPYLNEESQSEILQPAPIYYGNNSGCDNVRTTYKMHMLLKDNGKSLSPKQRAQLVKERCQTFMKENNMQFNMSAVCNFDNEAFMISRRYDLCICYHCKVASTNTKRVFYGLDHNFSLTDNINNISVPEVGRYTREHKINFHHLLSEKRKVNFMFVREPLERLLSAYLDKRAFSMNHYNEPSFSFKRFLIKILNKHMTRLDRHIHPYFERCRPCEIPYDYIGLQNHFIDDIKVLLQKIDASDKIAVPSRIKTGYNTYLNRDKLLKQYFEKVPNKLIHNLWEKYYKDYYIFGFPYPSHLMN